MSKGSYVRHTHKLTQTNPGNLRRTNMESEVDPGRVPSNMPNNTEPTRVIKMLLTRDPEFG